MSPKRRAFLGPTSDKGLREEVATRKEYDYELNIQRVGGNMCQ